MSFSEIISDLKGNEGLIDRLRLAIRAGKLFHGYIIEGKEADAQRLANAFISAALCEQHDGDACGKCAACRKVADGNSEDVIRIKKTGKSVKTDQIKNMIARTIQKSYTGNRRFIVISGADSMVMEVQNRLLKTLEEPPEGITIILIAENTESLVPTIRSRCQMLKMFSDGIEHNQSVDEKFRQNALSAAAGILMGRPVYSIWDDISKFTSSREAASGFISIAETFYRDVLIAEYDPAGRLRLNTDSSMLIEKCKRRTDAGQLAAAIESTETAAKDLAYGISAGRAVKYMIFNIQEKLNDNSNRSKV